MSVAFLLVQASFLQHHTPKMPSKAKSKPKMPKRGPMTVGVSSPHGQLMSIDIDPRQTVAEAKQAIMQSISASASASASASEEALAADWVELMHGCSPQDVNFRLCTYDGKMLDDHHTFASQMTRREMDTFYKVVWMKQHNLTEADWAFCHLFADRTTVPVSNFSIQMTQGTEFFVRPVWGDGQRHNDIIGLVYNHSLTEQHCMVKGKYKLNPMTVDWSQPISGMQFDLPRGVVVGDWAEAGAWTEEDTRPMAPS